LLQLPPEASTATVSWLPTSYTRSKRFPGLHSLLVSPSSGRQTAAAGRLLCHERERLGRTGQTLAMRDMRAHRSVGRTPASTNAEAPGGGAHLAAGLLLRLNRALMQKPLARARLGDKAELVTSLVKTCSDRSERASCGPDPRPARAPALATCSSRSARIHVGVPDSERRLSLLAMAESLGRGGRTSVSHRRRRRRRGSRRSSSGSATPSRRASRPPRLWWRPRVLPCGVACPAG
jgi:hypothetical protein